MTTKHFVCPFFFFLILFYNYIYKILLRKIFFHYNIYLPQGLRSLSSTPTVESKEAERTLVTFIAKGKLYLRKVYKARSRKGKAEEGSASYVLPNKIFFKKTIKSSEEKIKL